MSAPYIKAQKAYQVDKKRKVVLRVCECCGDKVSPYLEDSRVCADCLEKAEEHERENEKRRLFWEARTVDEIKDWIATYTNLVP